MADKLINIHPNSPPVSGYRDLTQNEVDLINAIKAKAAEVGALVDVLGYPEHDADKRWLAIGNTDLQKGFMALVRSVAKPTGF